MAMESDSTVSLHTHAAVIAKEEQRTMMMFYFWASYLIIPCDAAPVERKLVLLHPVYWFSQSHHWAACVAWRFL